MSQFFKVLYSDLNIHNSNSNKKKIGEAIEKYASALEYSEYIPTVGKYLKFLPEFAKGIGVRIKNDADGKLNDALFQKAAVEKVLREYNGKILIVIDDIDRLTNEQIRLVFQLVSSVAGFPNVIYLLSFDKASLFIDILFNLMPCTPIDDGFLVSASYTCGSIIWDLLFRISNEQERLEIMVDLISGASEDSLSSFAILLNRMELAQGRLAAQGKQRESAPFSVESITELEKVFVSRLHNLISETPLLDWNYYLIPAYLWSCFDKEGYSQYMRTQFENPIDNLVDAIQQGIITSSTKQRLDELEATKEKLTISIVQEEMQKPLLTREQVVFWISRFKNGNMKDEKFRQRLIDTFVNAIYLYDDKIVLTYNYKDGSHTVTLAQVEEIFGSEAKSGSDLGADAPPKQLRTTRFTGGS